MNWTKEELEDQIEYLTEKVRKHSRWINFEQIICVIGIISSVVYLVVFWRI